MMSVQERKMPNYLIVRDKRLVGKLVTRCPVINVDSTTPLSSLLSKIKISAHHKSIDALFILCHGYAGTNNKAQVCMDAGGMGLQLGAENLLHTNVSRWQAIAGICKNIVVYSCAAANTESGNEGSTADGKYLMGALAIYADTNVYAADRIQWYDPKTMDFGEWEGNLWAFTPSGIPASMTPAAPVEIGEVM
jgi:hypothetical protein